MSGDVNQSVRLDVIVVTVGAEQAASQLATVSTAANGLSTTVNTTSNAMGGMVLPVGAVNAGLDKTGKIVRNALSPLRTASRDMWGMGYALLRLNTTVFGNNEALAKLVDTLIALGAVFRVFSIIQSVASSMGMLGGVVKGLTGVYNVFNATLAANAFWMSIASAGVALVVGVAAYAAISSMAPKSYASGGTVPNTGMFYLHKGETVSNNSGPDYSNVNINITTGPINTPGDISNLFKQAAVNMVREKRRRGG